MKFVSEIISIGLMAGMMSIFLIPALKALAVRINLLDKANHRKIHQSPTPLIGGISIVLSVFLALLISPSFSEGVRHYIPLIGAAMLLFIAGVLDDKYDLNAKYKLIVQLCCAFSVTASGVRITSLYDVLGIGTIPVEFQFILTVIVITGVVNAFNLMDGIDGLAGGLSVLGFALFAILSAIYGDYARVCLYVAFIGALFGFLKFNLGTNKIFMGDAGSLLLGFVLIISGIELLEISQVSQKINHSFILFLIVGFFFVPVLDSLRVYLIRIKKGNSPFKADRCHLHHLFLHTRLSHSKISLCITIFVVVLILTAGIMAYFVSETFILAAIIFSFYVITKLLTMNKKLEDWKSKIKNIETR